MDLTITPEGLAQIAAVRREGLRVAEQFKGTVEACWIAAGLAQVVRALLELYPPQTRENLTIATVAFLQAITVEEALGAPASKEDHDTLEAYPPHLH